MNTFDRSTLNELSEYVRDYQAAPAFDKMPRRTLADKGINGPTGAHVIEEIHTPFNFAYVTFTTGSSAFQNIVGVTREEIPGRVKASHLALNLAGLKKGDRLLVTYPPLVNVFSKQALEEYGLEWFFLEASSRDALLLSLIKDRPNAVIGESSFLRAALEDAKKLGMADDLDKGFTIITAGTPLDEDLPETAERITNSRVHDLYGCQEFGWLTLDGIPLREDISFFETRDGYGELIAGGLPTGDSFPCLEAGHVCDSRGKIITYARKRTYPDTEVILQETTTAARETVERLARTILRIKARILRIDDAVRLGSDKTVLSLQNGEHSCRVDGPAKTTLFDALLEAQLNYQKQAKTDPAWIKRR
jgi:hypothetical protein